MIKIGLLLSSDDADIISEVMTDYNNQFDAIYCIDSGADNSIDIIKTFPNVRYAVTEQEIGINGSLLKDGIRQLLLSRIQDDYGYDGWIFPIQSDEMFHGNIDHLIGDANAEGANMASCMIAHFVMRYEGDVLTNRDYYFLGQCEIAGFKNQRGVYYNLFEHMRVLPHGLFPVKTANKVIIRKHFNMRNPEQLKKRIEKRLATGWQPAYKAVQDNMFVTDPKQMITAGRIYSDIKKYTGQFIIDPPHEQIWEGRIVQ